MPLCWVLGEPRCPAGTGGISKCRFWGSVECAQYILPRFDLLALLVQEFSKADTTRFRESHPRAEAEFCVCETVQEDAESPEVGRLTATGASCTSSMKK
jgi:hypothetical protein